MRKITVEITFDDPSEPDAFTGFHRLDASAIWSALQRAFPFSRGSGWTVQELDADNRSTITVGDPVGGR
jgi:hypothetical protein